MPPVTLNIVDVELTLERGKIEKLVSKGWERVDAEAFQLLFPLRSQLSAEVVMEATGRMPQPCRAVVSGPGPFNLAARRMLAGLNVDDESVTILSA